MRHRVILSFYRRFAPRHQHRAAKGSGMFCPATLPVIQTADSEDRQQSGFDIFTDALEAELWDELDK